MICTLKRKIFAHSMSIFELKLNNPLKEQLLKENCTKNYSNFFQKHNCNNFPTGNSQTGFLRNEVLHMSLNED